MTNCKSEGFSLTFTPLLLDKNFFLLFKNVTWLCQFFSQQFFNIRLDKVHSYIHVLILFFKVIQSFYHNLELKIL